MKKSHFAKSLLLSLFLVEGQVALADFPNAVVFLGEFYTDCGNNSNAPFTGTSSNWATLIGQKFDKTIKASSQGGTDYAYAFALTDASLFANSVSVEDQVALIPAGVSRNSIAFVWAGTNDVLFQNSFAFSTTGVAGNTLGIVNSVHAKGFKTPIVLNLFNFGLTPDQPTITPSDAVLAQQSIAINNALMAGIETLSYNPIVIDVYTLFNTVVTNPSLYGFSNVTDFSSIAPENPGYLWGLPISFESPLALPFHQILADYIYGFLSGAEYYSFLAEQPYTFLRGQNGVLRNQLFPVQTEHYCRSFHPFLTGTYAPQANPALNNDYSYKGNMGNVTLGFTERLSSAWTVGAAVGYNNAYSHYKEQGTSGHFNAQAEMLSFMASVQARRCYINGILNTGWLQFPKIKRNFVVGPTVEHMQGKTHGYTYSANLEGAYYVVNHPEKFQTGPLAEVSYGHITVKGYQEKGSLLGDTQYKTQNNGAYVTGLGWDMRFNRVYSPLTLTTEISALANYQWKQGERDILLRAVSLGGAYGAWPIVRKAVFFGSGNLNFTGTFKRGTSLQLGYSFNYGEQHMRASYVTASISCPL